MRNSREPGKQNLDASQGPKRNDERPARHPPRPNPRSGGGEEGKGEKQKDLIRDTRCNISKTIVFRERSDPLARSELWA